MNLCRYDLLVPKDSGLITNFEISDVVHILFKMSGCSFINLRINGMLTPKGRVRGSAAWGVASRRGEINVVVMMAVPAAAMGTGVSAGGGGIKNEEKNC